MTLPNFLIIGAPKSGTTSLYNYLRQHPQIYMSPVKEPGFFMGDGQKIELRGPRAREHMARLVTAIERYEALFDGLTTQTAIGEATTIYLYGPEAPRRIHYHIPSARLIAILRNPVDRAFSNYLMGVRVGAEPSQDFADALEQEEIRRQENWWWGRQYRKTGLYHEQLCRYLQFFPWSQIKVYLYEDLRDDPVRLVQDSFRFLGVDDKFMADVAEEHNVTPRVPRFQIWEDLLMKHNPLKEALKPFLPTRVRERVKQALRQPNLARPTLDPELRRQLLEYFRPDILKLQDLIERDLSAWLR